MLLVMFPGVAKLRNICFGRKICVREANMFLIPAKTFFVSEQHMFPARLNWETFTSATMFPSLARPLITAERLMKAALFSLAYLKAGQFRNLSVVFDK